MIITCPDCATTYELPDGAIGPEGRLVQCAGCGVSWNEFAEPVLAPVAAPVRTVPNIGMITPSQQFREPEIAPEVPALEAVAAPEPAPEPEPEPQDEAPPPPVLEDIDVKSEAARLARARQSANMAFERNRAARSKNMRGWAMLAGCLALLAAPAVAFPRQVTTLFPGAAQLYSKAGVTVNKRGLEFRAINYKRVLDEGVLVLEIEGTVSNVSGDTLRVPRLRIALMDEQKHDLYSWTLEVEPGALAPAGTAKFSSRLASPPSDAVNLQIRFAQDNEVAPGR